MLNVGLVMGSVMPRPRARPCTNVVLPTPRSPCSARVQSGGSAAASSMARAWVSAAEAVATPARSLAKMLVATVVVEIQRPGAWVAGPHEAPDARQARARKHAAPRLFEAPPFAVGRQREDELVILPVAQRGGERAARASRQRGGIERRSGAARRQR